jgi:predicted heme/steroid binding protein
MKLNFMKAITFLAMITLVMSMVVSLAACSGKTATTSTATTSTAAQSTASTTTASTTTASTTAASTAAASTTAASTATTQKTFTLAELAKYDGKNGNPAYIAVDGIVYDVTAINEWANGAHQGYPAGVDLTQDFKSYSHKTDVLSQAIIVGVLVA